jgi:O-antigen/teichoic acid export membrane protein
MDWKVPENKTTRDPFLLMLGQIFYNLVTLIILFFITRRYSPDQVGIYLFAFSFTGLLGVIINFGSSGLLIREIARDKSKSSRYIGNILGLNLFFSLAYLLLIIVITQLLFKEAFLMTFLVSIALIINQITLTFSSTFLAYRKIHYNLISGITSKIILLGLFPLFLYMQRDLLYLPLVHIVAAGYFFFVSSLILRTRIVRIKVKLDLAFCKRLITNSLPFFIISIFNIIYFKIDTIMISLIRSFSEVGFYNTAFNIVNATLFIPAVFIAVIYPVFSKHYGKQDLFITIYKRSTSQLLFISLILTLFLTMFSKPIVLLAFGEKFAVSWKPLFILSFSIPFIFVNKMNAAALISVNQEKGLVYTLMSGALINITLNAVVIPRYGFVGAAVTTIITEIAIFAILGSLFYRKCWKKEMTQEG